MESSLPSQDDDDRRKAEEMMEELVSLQASRWKAKTFKIEDDMLAYTLAAMCWNHDALPAKGPGCLLPDYHNGGYVYVPYDDDRDGLSRDMLQRMEKLEGWVKDPANKRVILLLDKMLEKEVNDKCFWDFLDGGDGARIDFFGKIKMLARYRLTTEGIDVSPSDPRNPRFMFAIAGITEFGHLRAQWYHLKWDCTEREVFQLLKNFQLPEYTAEAVLAQHVRALEIIEEPVGVARSAQALIEKLKAHKPDESDKGWHYFFCGPDEAKQLPLDDRDWIALRGPNDIKMMKRLTKEQGNRWPILVRRWERRHHDVCYEIAVMQHRQLMYVNELEKPRLDVRDENGEPYFDGGLISTMDYAYRIGPTVLGGEDDIQPAKGGSSGAGPAES